MKKYAFSADLDSAREIVDAFAHTSGVHCALVDGEGRAVCRQGAPGRDCAFCRLYSEAAGVSRSCETLHGYGARQSERFGGRYIYFCPVGMCFFASPIITGGAFSGALVGGPVRIVEVDDLLDGDPLDISALTEEAAERVRDALLAVPSMKPKKLEYLSNQLFANAVYVSDSGHELFLLRERQARQDSIGGYVTRLKERGERTEYPVAKEQELCAAVSHADRRGASALLNELLGHIFFYTEDPSEIRTRITELLAVLSRAAVSGGASGGRILEISHSYMSCLHSLNSQEALTAYLAESLNSFINQVFGMMDVKHADTINKAREFMRENFDRRLSLEETAEYVGYSPTYFSRIFKEEMGVSFKEALNEIRIEKSKSLLHSTTCTIAEICSITGFNDQSYFCKVFKRTTGVTPDRFRKRTRRLNAEKEYGLR